LGSSGCPPRQHLEPKLRVTQRLESREVSRRSERLNNILTVDVEEWYHARYVMNRASGRREERVSDSLATTLELLNEHNVRATFFIVGELAEKHPEILETISDRGHEIAFHGWHHEPLWEIDAERFRSQIRRFNLLLNEKCLGFRAPSFSLSNRTRWTLGVLEGEGFIYDSSIFPVKTPLYGVLGAPVEPYRPSHEDLREKDESRRLWEFPLLTYSLMGLKIPMAGGFYLRVFPSSLVRASIARMNKRGAPAVVYVHNWELDPGTPRLRLSPLHSFVTYYNGKETGKRMKAILSDSRFTSFRDYMEEQGLA